MENTALNLSKRIKKLIKYSSILFTLFFIFAVLIYTFFRISHYEEISEYWLTLFERRLVELDKKIDESRPLDYINYAVLNPNGEIIKSSKENYLNISLKESSLFGRLDKIKDGESLLIVYPDLFDGVQRVHYIRNTNGNYSMFTFDKDTIFPDFIDIDSVFLFSIDDIVWYSNDVNWLGDYAEYPIFYYKSGIVYLVTSQIIDVVPNAKITVFHDVGSYFSYFFIIFIIILLGLYGTYKLNQYSIKSLSNLDDDINSLILKIKKINVDAHNANVNLSSSSELKINKTIKSSEQYYFKEYNDFNNILNSLINDIDLNLKLINIQNIELNNRLIQTMSVISKICEYRDYYTSGHQNNVHIISLAIAEELKLSDDDKSDIFYASLIFDSGKIYVPSDILNKPSRLNELEYSIIKKHVEYSCELLSNINFPENVSRIILQHHEHLDGSGYPNQLKEDSILLCSRILTVADVYDALRSHRTYRASYTFEESISILNNGIGTKYDQEVVDALIKVLPNLNITY